MEFQRDEKNEEKNEVDVDDDDQECGEDAGVAAKKRAAERSAAEHGAAVRFTIKEKGAASKLVALSQHDLYCQRGAGLAAMSLWEWVITVSVAKRSSGEEEDEEDVDDSVLVPPPPPPPLSSTSSSTSTTTPTNAPHVRAGAGRVSNRVFEFDERSPIRSCYVQRLRSLNLVPIYAGGPPPRLPSFASDNHADADASGAL